MSEKARPQIVEANRHQARLLHGYQLLKACGIEAPTLAQTEKAAAHLQLYTAFLNLLPKHQGGVLATLNKDVTTDIARQAARQQGLPEN